MQALCFLESHQILIWFFNRFEERNINADYYETLGLFKINIYTNVDSGITFLYNG